MFGEKVFQYFNANPKTSQGLVLISLHHLAEANNVSNKNDSNFTDYFFATWRPSSKIWRGFMMKSI